MSFCRKRQDGGGPTRAELIDLSGSVVDPTDIEDDAQAADTSTGGNASSSASLALLALRSGPPERRALPDLGDEVVRKRALRAFDEAVHAESTWGWRSLEDFQGFVGRCLGAGLRQGGYRSAPNVLSAAALFAERVGMSPCSETRRALADATRFCTRGQGQRGRSRSRVEPSRFEGRLGAARVHRCCCHGGLSCTPPDSEQHYAAGFQSGTAR